jgi:hypothetical protein
VTTFRFTSPDGKTYRVNGPEGATEAEAFQILQQQIGGEQPAAPAEQPAAPSQPQSYGDSVRSQWNEYGRVARRVAEPLAHGARRMTTGISQLAPDVGGAGGKLAGMLGVGSGEPWFPDARTALADRGMAYGWDQPAEGFIDRGLEMAGPSAILGPLATLGMAGPAVSATQQAARSAMPGIMPAIRTAGEAGRQFMATRPAASLATDLAGGMGAGMGMEAGRSLGEAFDAGPEVTAALEATFGLGGGALAMGPQAVTRGAQRAGDKLRRAVTPSSELRAAREVQKAAVGAEEMGTAAGRERLEHMDRAVRTAPRGTSPARATESPDLLALEARVMADDPVVGDTIRGQTLGARQNIERLSRRNVGPRQTPGEWEESVVSSVLPPGAQPITRGTTQQMVKQAEDAFGPAYAPFRNAPSSASRNDVRAVVSDALEAPDAIIDDSVRASLAAWAQRNVPADEQLSTVNGLIEFRHKVRTELRRARAGSGTGRSAGAEDRTELLDRMDDALTDLITRQLDGDMADGLRAVDGQYRKFKVLQDAVGRTVDRELQPGAMEAALRTSAGKPRLARGDEESTLALVRGGRDVARVLKDPQEAARYVQNVPDDVVRQRRANLANEVLDRAVIQARADEPKLLSGRELTKQIDESRASLQAAGFTDRDIRNLERTAATLRMLERQAPPARPDLMTDKTGTMLKLISGFMGIKGIRGLGKMFGVWDKGASIRVASKGARGGEFLSDRYLRSGAERLLRDAHQPTEEGRALYRLLLTKPTDPPAQVREARNVVRAYMLGVAAESTPDDLTGEE